jgi:sterol 3beta-glucosyltransferase
MVSITVGSDPLAGNESPVLDSDSSSERASSDKSVILNPENEAEPYVVQLSMIRRHPIWDDLMSHVEKANAAVAADTTDWPGSRLYIDYDPRADLEDEDLHNGLSSLQRSVSSTLGLDRTKEFFSEWRFPPPTTHSEQHVFLVTSAHTHGRVIINNGYFAVNAECIGFWSRSIAFGRDVCYRIPLARVKNVKGQGRCMFGRDYILAIEVQGRRDVHIHFHSAKKRDAALEQANRFIGLAQERLRDTIVSSPTSLSPTDSRDEVSTLASKPQRTTSPDELIATAATTAAKASASPQRSRRSSRSTSPSSSSRSTLMRSASSILAPLSRLPSTVQNARNANIIRAIFPKTINVPSGVLVPMPSKHFVCLTIGSRGDVQPYIALGKGLQKEGHRVTIVTHEEYKEWVTGFGIGHRTAGGDPGALMKLSVENKVRSIFDERCSVR